MMNVDTEVCIVGLGPAGLGAALRLAASSLARSTVCFEAGVSAQEKYCSILQGSACRRVEPCQMISGVGGCSVLSGGKVSDFPAGRAMGPFVGGDDKLQEQLAKALSLFRQYIPLDFTSASESSAEECCRKFGAAGFLFKYYPAHRYRQADLVRGYTEMIAEITAAGVSVQLSTQVTKVSRDSGGFTVMTRSGSDVRTYRCRRVLIAAGRLGIARNSVESNSSRVTHSTTPFSV